MKNLSGFIIALMLSSVASAASFDCTKASTFIEKEICSNQLLGKFDDALNNNYNAMLATNLGDGGAALKKEQRGWIVQRNKCTSDQCLLDMYRKRIDSVCDAPVVSGVHASCVQSSDIEATPAAISGHDGTQATISNITNTEKSNNSGFGFKEYVIGALKSSFQIAQCEKVSPVRNDLEMCQPTNRSVTIAGVPGQIRILAFRDSRLVSVDVDVRAVTNSIGAVNDALTEKYGSATEQTDLRSRWILGEDQIDSEIYPSEGILTIMFFNREGNSAILAAQRQSQIDKEENTRKQSAKDL
jgi:uncharacterized protein